MKKTNHTYTAELIILFLAILLSHKNNNRELFMKY